ncbi:hypothetical protein Thal_0026 [Thermocrinis albus DSM 14484]|uniref:Uncharacterized protein n=1 Tax=Thermocrinis albus (strain DSM 14484 / JCM 11386 / HI 11/12) TaxID=638303 RepID=D3SNC7_THEAH|nr:hypothetical protein [Thermocrinis albus]ADC88664.1 hypothetical protein Thal_0026 [Thermocrinis albus DSM 14484]
MLVLLLLVILSWGMSQDCESLTARLNSIRTQNIYEDLTLQAQKLIEEGCAGKKHSLKAADDVLSALETLTMPELDAKGQILSSITNKRMRKALLLLNETRKYKKSYPDLYFYQLLFYRVAIENRRVKDYNYALKYSHASYLLGTAILTLARHIK